MGYKYLIPIYKPAAENNFSITRLKEKFYNRNGYEVQLISSYKINSKIAIGIGFGLQEQKYYYTLANLLTPDDIINGTTSSIESDFSIATVSIPLSLRYFPAANKRFGLVLDIGYYRKIKFSEEITLSGNLAVDRPSSYSTTTQTKDHNVVISFGPKFEVPMFNNKIFIAFNPSYQVWLVKNTALFFGTPFNFSSINANMGIGFSF